jgi:hypothetical protein
LVLDVTNLNATKEKSKDKPRRRGLDSAAGLARYLFAGRTVKAEVQVTFGPPVFTMLPARSPDNAKKHPAILAGECCKHAGCLAIERKRQAAALGAGIRLS